MDFMWQANHRLTPRPRSGLESLWPSGLAPRFSRSASTTLRLADARRNVAGGCPLGASLFKDFYVFDCAPSMAHKTNVSIICSRTNRGDTMKKALLAFLLVGMINFLFGQSSMYFSGTIVQNKKQIAFYWNNGKRIELSGGIGNNGSDSDGISIYNGTIYIIGRYWNGNTMMPCVWINNEKNDLSIGSDGLKDSGGRASSISINKSEVLIGGDWSKDNRSVPCYWHNGSRIDLPYPKDGIDATVESVYINDEHQYACGFFYQGANPHACYWIDGTYNELKILNETTSGAYKILQSENALYICGDYQIKNKQYGYLWKNGSVINIEDSISALDFAEYKGMIYVLGVNTRYSVFYWNGTTKQNLAPDSDGETGYDLRKIIVYSDKIYTCGAYTWDQGYSRQGCYLIDRKPNLFEKESVNISGLFILE